MPESDNLFCKIHLIDTSKYTQDSYKPWIYVFELEQQEKVDIFRTIWQDIPEDIYRNLDNVLYDEIHWGFSDLMKVFLMNEENSVLTNCIYYGKVLFIQDLSDLLKRQTRVDVRNFK